MSLVLIRIWSRFRSRFWASLAFDVTVLAAVFFGIHAWQTRDLPIDQAAPVTFLPALGSPEHQTAVPGGRAGIVYFFAPWCRVCRASIDNLDDLVASGQVSWGTVIALDYADTGEVQNFVDRAGISLPVLLGNAQTAADWSVRAFPTYYVIDGLGRIHSRSLGYSTYLGMRVRVWLARRRSR